MTRIRSYSELKLLTTLEERYEYLRLSGQVGDATFGSERWLNQAFYRSSQWRHIRQFVILRDEGCDLGIDGYQIHTDLYVHHMNPMTVDALTAGDESVLDPEFLITVTLRTHNAIHYGDKRQLPQPLVERRPGDTKLW